jgi:NAD(P)-dependent dehydrogenase (short-subunit alcohol dehydrogenase family)
MEIHGSVVLVTGGNRGIGAEFVRQLKERGARKIYLAARNIDAVHVDGVELVTLDVTNDAQIAAAAVQAGDVQVLINNAGVNLGETLIEGNLDVIRHEFETNFFGPLKLMRAFAPVLARNGGGAVLNVLSALSWISSPGGTVYAAGKAAAWSATDGARIELAGQGTQVTGLHMGMVDTDMTAGWDLAKVAPSVVVTAALDGLEVGATEVLADDTATQVKASLVADPAARYADFLASLV